MYKEFSTDYDRFVNWPARLAVELPLIERVVPQADSLRYILDAACGTGMHAVALARRGWRVTGADISPEMIARARANAQAAGVQVRFEVAGFGELARVLNLSPTPLPPSPPLPGEGKGVGGWGEVRPFDAVLCLGNSLPHVLTPQALRAALADFAACLRTGGFLLIQNLNYNRILARRERWMEPQAHREGEQEWLFLRFYDFDPDGLLTFNVVRLHRRGGLWEQRVLSTRLWPMRQAELTAALEEAGFGEIALYGDMQGTPFEPDRSPNLVVVARKMEGVRWDASLGEFLRF
ncbi:MAG: class I SAM-dependent methyltransferase [Anaerolineae bacterium]|nr:class I SAM-dependent methyltransferase [Anaerolineae bacterium]